MIARAPFTREGWIFELKHDGFRAFARSGTSPELRSRWARSMAETFPEVMDTLASLPDAALDGALVVPDGEGRSDFEALRRRSLLHPPREIARLSNAMPAVVVVFDVLEVSQRDVRSRPLSDRHAWLLDHLMSRANVEVSHHVPTHSEVLFREITRHDQEGIVAKRLNAPYRAGRQSTWLKIKNKHYSRRGAIAWQGR